MFRTTNFLFASLCCLWLLATFNLQGPGYALQVSDISSSNNNNNNNNDEQGDEYDDIRVSSSQLNGPINYHNISPTGSNSKATADGQHLPVSNHIGKPLVPLRASYPLTRQQLATAFGEISTSTQQPAAQQSGLKPRSLGTTADGGGANSSVSSSSASASTASPSRQQRHKVEPKVYTRSKPRIDPLSYDDVQKELKFLRAGRATNRTQNSIVAPARPPTRRPSGGAGPSVTSYGRELGGRGGNTNSNNDSTCRWRSFAEFKKISLSTGELIVRDAYEQPCYILTLRGFIRWNGNDFIPLNNFKVHLHSIDIMPTEEDDDYDADDTSDKSYNASNNNNNNNEDLDGSVNLDGVGETATRNDLANGNHPQSQQQRRNHRRRRPLPLVAANCTANMGEGFAPATGGGGGGGSSSPSISGGANLASVQPMPLHWIDRSFSEELTILVDCGFLVLRTQGDGSRLNLMSISFYQNGNATTTPTLKKLSRNGAASMARSEHLVFTTEDSASTKTNSEEPPTLISMPISSRYMCQNRIVLTAKNQVQLVLDRFELQRLSLPPIRQVVVADGRSSVSSIRIPIIGRRSKAKQQYPPVAATTETASTTTKVPEIRVARATAPSRQPRDVTMARKSTQTSSLIFDSVIQCPNPSKPHLPLRSMMQVEAALANPATAASSEANKWTTSKVENAANPQLSVPLITNIDFGYLTALIIGMLTLNMGRNY